jgi:DNA mismatch endonuclease (patch repair protein)
MPNFEYWSAKIERNKARDRMVNRILKEKGWRVLRIWESDLAKHPLRVSRKIRAILQLQEPQRQQQAL